MKLALQGCGTRHTKSSSNLPVSSRVCFCCGVLFIIARPLVRKWGYLFQQLNSSCPKPLQYLHELSRVFCHFSNRSTKAVSCDGSAIPGFCSIIRCSSSSSLLLKNSRVTFLLYATASITTVSCSNLFESPHSTFFATSWPDTCTSIDFRSTASCLTLEIYEGTFSDVPSLAV